MSPPMITLSVIDSALILLFLAAVVVVGFFAGRKTSSRQADYLLAGRSLTLPIFVMTLVSTWYGGILGVGEFSYLYGISNWVVMGVPYYIFAALFAFLLAKKIRSTNLYSIPDKLHQSYDKRTAVLGSILIFVLMTPAPYILMFAVMFKLLFGWSLEVSILVTAVAGLSYLYIGGFRSDIATDVLEFFLMFVGFAVIVPFAAAHFGGFDFLKHSLPPLHLAWHGGHSAQFIIVWFFIALWTLVDPAFHQRCYAAKDGATARKGILVSIVFWFVFDFLTATAGLYARAVLPNLDQPMLAYPMLAEVVLPIGAKGLFYIGMLATMMSTMNTLGFVSAQTLGRDIMMRLKLRDWKTEGSSLTPSLAGQSPNWVEESAAKYTKLGLILSFILSVAIALMLPSVIKIWYTIGTVVIPGLLVPLVASYFDRLTIPPRYAFLSMTAGWMTSLLWLLLGYLLGEQGHVQYLWGIEPMYPGLAFSLLLWGIGRWSKRG